jgi:hypothetical protein
MQSTLAHAQHVCASHGGKRTAVDRCGFLLPARQNLLPSQECWQDSLTVSGGLVLRWNHQQSLKRCALLLPQRYLDRYLAVLQKEGPAAAAAAAALPTENPSIQLLFSRCMYSFKRSRKPPAQATILR